MWVAEIGRPSWQMFFQGQVAAFDIVMWFRMTLLTNTIFSLASESFATTIREEGTIDSPNFPDSYPDNNDTVRILHRPLEEFKST